MERGVCMVLLRLDGLSELNAYAGSKIVDQVLRALAQMIETVRRDGDILGRTGAADFALLVADADPALLPDTLGNLSRGLGRSRFRDAAGRSLPITVLGGTTVLAAERDFEREGQYNAERLLADAQCDLEQNGSAVYQSGQGHIKASASAADRQT